MNGHPKQHRNRHEKKLFSSGVLRFILLLLVIAAGLYLSQTLNTQNSPAPELILSNYEPTPADLVPGSRGIGNPPGAIEVFYRTSDRRNVTALLDGPVTSVILSGEEEAGNHTLRFNGVITDSTFMEGYTLVRRVVPDGNYKIII